MKHTILVKEPNKEIEKVELENLSLETMQTLVGGYIEAIIPFKNRNLVMILNEEGKIQDLEPNIRLGTDYIAGTLLIVASEDNDFRGLNKEELGQAIFELELLNCFG